MNILETLNKHANSKDKLKTFIVFENKKYSFETINKLVNSTCNYFRHLKLKKKDIITTYLDNSLEFVLIYFASIRYGSIINPNPHYVSSIEIDNHKKKVNPKITFITKENKKKFIKNSLNLIEVENTENFLKKIKKFSSKFITNNSQLSSANIAVLYYSSGSTGDPKLIKMSNRAIINSQKFQKKSILMESGDNHLCILPLAHTSSLRSTLKFCLYNRKTVYLYKNFWSIKNNILDIIESNKISFVMTVPSILSMMSILFKNKKNLQKKIKTVKFFATGSSYLSEEVALSFENTFGIPLVSIYGLSETCAISMTTFNKISNFELQSVGKPMSKVKIKILNDKGKPIKNGESGELSVNTPAIFSGYYKKQNRIKKNTYFKTGDIFTKDKNGYLYYIERKKNIIIKSGINITANDINKNLIKLKYIKDIFTTSTDDVFHGEVPKTYLVLNKKINLEKIKKDANKILGDFKTPRDFIVIKKIPRSLTGKVKYSLIDR